MQSIQSPLPQFFDLDGSALDAGYVYIGIAGSNPETTPADVFWDMAGTQPAAQPLRTVDGYVSRTGKPALVFTTELNYSISVRDRKGRLIYSTLSIIPTESTTSAVVSALYFLGDLDTGFEHPSDGTIVVKTNGLEAFRFNSSGVITQSLPSGGEFAVLGSSAAGSESGMRLNQSSATSGIALRLSNSGLNVQATLRGRGDGGLTAYVGQTSGAANTSGIQAFDIQPDGNIVVGNSGVNSGRIVTSYNVDTGASAYARFTAQSDGGQAHFQVNSIAGGRATSLYSNVGGNFNIYTQGANVLQLGTNNIPNRIVIGATGGITFNDSLTFAGGAGVTAKNIAKAWVNFNGSGVVAIRDSFNVTSITDNGVGDYTVNFTAALTTGYAWSVSSGRGGALKGLTQESPYQAAPTTTTFRLVAGYDIAGGDNDPAYVSAIFYGA